MASIEEYLQWRGDISFDEVAPLPIDSLILATVCYIHLNNVLPVDDMETQVSIKTAYDAYMKLPASKKGITRRKADVTLMETLANCKRFENITLMANVENIDTDAETQFAAITYVINDSLAHVTFRGTDNTVPGWKEDFNMGFMEEIPGQKMALNYLEKVAAVFPGKLIVSGHSKGGNLAIYSSTKCKKKVQDRIQAVYSFDGPGFITDMLESPEYLRLSERVHSYIPNSSLVGMLMNYIEDYAIVKSSNPNIGMLQHDPYSWEIMGGDFVYANKLENSCSLTDNSVKKIITELTLEERQILADSLFESFSAGDITYLQEIFKPANIMASVKAKNSLTPEQEKNIKEANKKLSKLIIEAIKEQIKAQTKTKIKSKDNK